MFRSPRPGKARIVDVAEQEWRSWAPAWGFPELKLDCADTPLVVTPHPDDGVLGAGGLLSLLGRAELVTVTNGGAAANRCSIETERALRSLWLNGTAVRRLDQPAGYIDEDVLEDALIPMLWPGRWCLATWRGDGDSDHEAVGRAAAVACAATGARLLDYPMGAWEWARPADPRVPWERAVRVELPLSVRRAKITAIAAFESRVPEFDDLAPFLRPFEVFLA
jgi:LmbE family N-acetylglucosaminyl deacetylase